MPEEGSMYYPRVQHYRELLDSLPMDAYTHGCILHPELTVDSMIPAYATSRIRSMYWYSSECLSVNRMLHYIHLVSSVHLRYMCTYILHSSEQNILSTDFQF